MGIKFLNKIIPVLFFSMFAALPAFAGKESERALKEYEEEVRKMYDQPVDPSENLLMDTYLLKESEGLTDFEEVGHGKTGKPLKAMKLENKGESEEL